MFASNSRTWEKCDANYFDCGMIVGARQADSSITETADFLGL